MKTILVKYALDRGNSVWLERKPYGSIVAVADLHPDDSNWVIMVGNAKQCWKAVRSVYRAYRNNRLGRIVFGKH